VVSNAKRAFRTASSDIYGKRRRLGLSHTVHLEQVIKTTNYGDASREVVFGMSKLPMRDVVDSPVTT